MKRIAVALGVALALAVVCWLLQREQGPGAAPPGAGPSHAAEAPAEGPADPIRHAGREEAPQSGRLRIRVRRTDGQPVQGTVDWILSSQAPRTADLLMADTESPTRFRRVSHQGGAEIDCGRGMYAWLRVTAAGAPELWTYALVPPFSGIEERTFELTAGRHAIHAFVLHEDLLSPASNAELRLYERNMRSSAPARLVHRSAVDVHGYAVFAGLAPGAYVLCAGNVPPDAGAPAAQAILFHEGGASELPCTLVVPGPRRTARFRVQSRFGPLADLPPRLFLRRQGAREGELHPLPGGLVAGVQDLTVQLPAGDYELDAIPLGLLELTPAGMRYHVPPDRDVEFSVLATASACRTTLELAGLGVNDYPVTVRPLGLRLIAEPDASPLYLGPHLWHLARQQITGRFARIRLAVSGRTGAWLSRNELDLLGREVRCDLAPATRLSVLWLSEDPAHDEQPMLEAAALGQIQVVAMLRQLRPVDGATRSMLFASLIVPRGPAELRCFHAERGTTHWRRTVTADRADLELLVQ